ncbi:alpha-amlyase [Neobacillus notoginsengisoli]|uniref:alpha-amylase n=1 Tax=Neobacillus notoginsengisoli TaxID=1578198 RepID=A0A417YZ44_9BACI|nr:alpha-amylase family glycosyl hydrolase [Neobacillus notoginsengisoli]RHW43180.1 alpha-amlyase [Neobacillus notoginsengisoli]
MKAKLTVYFLIPLLLIGSLQVQALEKDEGKWQDEIIYFLMVDRFNNGDLKNDANVNAKDPEAFNGGDFQGILDRIDHIKGMGFTAIMLSPIFDNVDGGYHGYWVNDFYKTEEHFGTIKQLKKLVDKAHKSGLKVLIDFPANSTGPDSKLFLEKGAEWFHEKTEISDSSSRDEQLNGWVEGLPDLNHENPEVRAYLIDAAKYWMKETNIDGYRLSSAEHVPADFWREFTEAVKAQKEEFYLIADLGPTSAELKDEYKDAGFSGMYDYELNGEMRSSFAQTNQGTGAIFAKWKEIESAAKKTYETASFYDGPGMDRFTRDMLEAKQYPVSQWKQALNYLYTAPGIPIVFYGTEIAVDGGSRPDNMKLMDFRTEKELIDHLAKLSELRHTLPSLTRGTMELLYDKDGMTVFKREYEKETAIVAINNTTKTQTVQLTPEQLDSEGKELRGMLGGDKSIGEKEGFTLVLDRDESEIYVLAPKLGLNYLFIVTVVAIWIFFISFFIFLARRGKKRRMAE